MTQVNVVIVGTGNKIVDDLVKMQDGLRVTQMGNFEARNRLVQKISEEVDEAKKSRLQQSLESVDLEIEEVDRKLKNIGIRAATDEEKRAALQSITNVDERRRVAPGYLHPAKAFVLVPVEKPAKAEKPAKVETTPSGEQAAPTTKAKKAKKTK